MGEVLEVGCAGSETSGFFWSLLQAEIIAYTVGLLVLFFGRRMVQKKKRHKDMGGGTCRWACFICYFNIYMYAYPTVESSRILHISAYTVNSFWLSALWPADVTLRGGTAGEVGSFLRQTHSFQLQLCSFWASPLHHPCSCACQRRYPLTMGSLLYRIIWFLE